MSGDFSSLRASPCVPGGDELDRLEQLARSATRGEWEVFETPHVMPASEVLGQHFAEHHWKSYGICTTWVHPQLKGKSPVVGLGSSADGPVQWLTEDDAAFIAALNPATVLRIIAAARLALPEGRVSGLVGGWRRVKDDPLPKDGSVFMVVGRDYDWPEIVRWETHEPDVAEEVGEDGYWTYAEPLLADATDDAASEEWTHWQPLPPAPSIEESEGKQ